MGKKSRKNTGNRNNGPSSNNENDAPNNGDSPRSLSTTRIAVSRDGRMDERHGRRLYSLLEALAAMALPGLERERQITHGVSYEPLRWNPVSFGLNTMGDRMLVCSYILRNIESLSLEIDSGRRDQWFRSVLGRRLSSDEKATIRTWKVHVDDDFFVIGHAPSKGAIFVQVVNLGGDGKMIGFMKKMSMNHVAFSFGDWPTPSRNSCVQSFIISEESTPASRSVILMSILPLSERH